ncbi:hypothetical protein PACILC2_37230 [Paenibacillus cisolokensis]|uniref:Uncharacterized protein n=1 Tax=Paenibacillus cisolokensis TaxID=1658519 RepID=A0ABQ4NAE0_9BACL|nr:hypothetical protein PACILC2_37230 [Paenibacillus cisolokensis]
MRSERKQWIKKVLGVLAVYLILQQIVTFGYAVARIAPYPLPNNEPYWKFVTGLNVSTNGKFSKADNEYVHQFPLGEERNQAELQLIKERLQNKSELLKLFSSKFDEMWGGGDMSTFWSMDNTAQKSWRIYFDGAERIMYLFAIGLSCVSVAYSIRSNNYAHFFSCSLF